MPVVPPGNLKYCRPSDIITSLASWSALTGTVSSDPDYGLASLYDGKMSKPLKFIDEPVVAVRVVGDFGAAQRVDAMALPNSNIPAGTVMKAELSNDPTFATVGQTVNVTMGAIQTDGHRARPWADFVPASGYLIGGYRYASWYVPVVSQVQWLGELLVMSNLREFSQWPQFQGRKGFRRPFLEHLFTEYAVQRVLRRKIKQELVSFGLKGNDQDYEDLNALADDAGGAARAFFLSANSDLKTDKGLYGRLTPETVRQLQATETSFDLNDLTIDFQEDSRSLPF